MGRTPCCDKNSLKRGPWTAEEDQKLIHYINKHGAGNWRTLPTNAGLQRYGKSCRLRWTNYLRPDIKRGRFSFEEEQTIIQLHSILGNKWSAIASRLPGRTDNEIKNFWNTHMRKKLLRMGIDPVTHSPRLDLLNFSTMLNNSSHHHINNISRILAVTNSLLTHNIKSENLCNLLPNANVDQQMLPLVQDFPNTSFDPIQDQEPQFVQQPNNNVDFGLLENCQLVNNNWQLENGLPSNLSHQDYFALQNYNCYESVDPQLVMDHVLNSNSTQVNSGSTTTTTEDEREISYCSSLLNFDVSNISYVNEFM